MDTTDGGVENALGDLLIRPLCQIFFLYKERSETMRTWIFVLCIQNVAP